MTTRIQRLLLVLGVGALTLGVLFLPFGVWAPPPPAEGCHDFTVDEIVDALSRPPSKRAIEIMNMSPSEYKAFSKKVSNP